MDEMLSSIKQAEAEAARLKEEAVAEAGAIIERARGEAAAAEKQSAKERAIYRKQALDKAKRDGEEMYNGVVAESRAKAKKYSEEVLAKSDGVVLKIVGRVSGGSC